MAGQVTVTEALTRGTPPLRTFMLRQTREADLGAVHRAGQGAEAGTPQPSCR